MEENINTQKTDDVDKIRVVLNMLKKQINVYTTTKNNLQSETELTRSERIQKLMMEEKRLTLQFQNLRKEIKHYEKKYEKALKKKVKLIKLQMKEDEEKLNFLKDLYFKLDMQSDVIAPHEITNATKKSKKQIATKKLKTYKTMKFKRNTAMKKKLRIKIKKRVKLKKRKILNAKNDTQRKLTDLITVIKPTVRNTRECTVMLERLTREQMNRYATEIRLEQQQSKTQKVLENDKSVKKTVAPNWHIKIPKSVFEESQEVPPYLNISHN